MGKTILYRQGRVVALTSEEAVRLVEEKHPGVCFEKIIVRPCPVQPWGNMVWWEWLGRVGEAPRGVVT